MFWFQLKEKVKFYLNAKNAYGLHSPYVFDFYNSVKEHSKSLKSSPETIDRFSKKESRIILSIIKNLKHATVLVISDEGQTAGNWSRSFLSDSEVLFSKSLVNLANSPSKFDLIILHKLLSINQKELEDYLPALISNNSTVIIPHIHASKDLINRWKSLTKNNYVRVSMDLFFIGVLLFRKESTKQDFRIRF